MIKGTYKYKGHMYDLKGYDYGDNIVMYLSTDLTDAKNFADGGIDDEEDHYRATWEDLYVAISPGVVSVEQNYIREKSKVSGEKDKLFKSKLNQELFETLGLAIRGMKDGCRPDLLVKEDLYETSFSPMDEMTYMYDYDCKITLAVGIIRKLDYVDVDGNEVHLAEDGTYFDKIYRKDGVPLKKFQIDTSFFLGEDTSSDWDFSVYGEDKIFSLQEVIERNPNKSYVWLKERKYEVIKTKERMEQVCKMIWEHKGIVSFDTETTGLTMNVKCREGYGDRLVGMVFCIKPGEAFYFPIAHKKIQNLCNGGNESYIINKYFKPLLEKKDLLCHNGAYDWKVMYNYGISINLVHDTMILFKLTLWNDHTNLALGLKSLTHQFLGRDSFELSDFVVGKFGADNIKFWDLEEESVKYYACPDTDNALELLLWAEENDLLGRYNARKIYQIEVLFSIVIAYQEYYGHHADVNRMDELVADIRNDINTSYAKLVEIAGMDFNPKSSPDMQRVCFEKLKLPVIELTDAGNPSTGKETRKKWLKSSIPETQKEFVRNLNKYLDARTLESNFTKNFDKYATKDGLMFSEVQQFLETGRVSTKAPNYQGYSDTVKKYIVPREGYYAIDADYSSVEARIMCSMAGCTNMVNKMKDPDADYHRLKASDMFNVPYELVTPELRKMSKGVNFGILYGLGDPNLGANLYGSVSPENTKAAAKQKERYFNGMEELRGFIDISKNQGLTDGYSTTFFERRRYYDQRKTRKDKIGRQSCNARIQGTAADIYKLAMVRFFTEILSRGWMGKVLIAGFVHDECYIEVSKSLNPAIVLTVLRKSMMLEIDGWCPLFTGMGVGHSWYEAKHNEIPVQVQEMIEEKYGETGFDWWNGDTDELCNRVEKYITDYLRDRVINYLKDSNNWGKVFLPKENEICHDLLKDMSKGLKVDGCVDYNIAVSDNMLENLKEFCRVFDCEELYDQANIQIPKMEKTEAVDLGVVSEGEEEEVDATNALIERVNAMGVHSTIEAGERKIYIKMLSNNLWMGMVKKTITAMPGEIQVIAIKDNEFYKTGLSADIKAYPKILSVYIQAKSMGGIA